MRMFLRRYFSAIRQLNDYYEETIRATDTRERLQIEAKIKDTKKYILSLMNYPIFYAICVFASIGVFNTIAFFVTIGD